jgi:UDP:flavonoid glycosyltransferase YjiC (YdhE family)
VFVNINGSGMGHLSTCLAYANRLRGRVRSVFFSLAAAVEIIHDMGFEADYFVSRFWSRASSWAWDQQLALRLGLLFARVRPDAVVFDGTWPYRGLLHAAAVYGVHKLVWSNLVLYKSGMRAVPVPESRFDLILRLGEIGSTLKIERAGPGTRKVLLPPVTLLKEEELLGRDAARDALGFDRDGRYALFSLGPGNLKDVSGIGRRLIDEMKARDFEVVWARAPISVQDVELPPDVTPLAVYPLVRLMRAFDVYVGAAGYNSCCEVLQAGIPALFVPNMLVSDDQTRRAELVAEAAPAVVSPCETAVDRSRALDRLLALRSGRTGRQSFDLGGAQHAADEIVALVEGQNER